MQGKEFAKPVYWRFIIKGRDITSKLTTTLTEAKLNDNESIYLLYKTGFTVFVGYRKIPLEISMYESIKEIKLKYSKKSGVKLSTCSFTFNGEELEDEKKVEDYLIQEGDFIDD
jgi:hypothetical protein